jgi:hypothetical protein
MPTVNQFRTLDSTGSVPSIGDRNIYTTGTLFYVDSNYGSDSNDGLTPSTAVATLAAAAALCTANKHDIVVLMPGHTENITTEIEFAISGMEVVSLGRGSNRAQFTTTAATDAKFNITGDNIVLRDICFVAGVNSGECFLKMNSGSGWIVDGCEFYQKGGATDALIAIDVVKSNQGAAIRNCRFYTDSTACDSAIDISSASADFLTIENCYIDGYYNNAGIYNATGNVAVWLSIYHNYVANHETGDYAIELVSACTGEIAYNRLFADSSATCLDPGACSCFCNEANFAVDTGSRELPTTGDDVTGIYSDTTVIESDTTVVESDTTVIESDTIILTSDTTVIESDTTVIESDTTIIESQSLVILSAVSDILSDTTIIASDLLLVLSDTSDTLSAVTKIYSDTSIIYSDTSIIYSDTTIIYSDTSIIYSDTTIIASDLLLVYSDTTIIASDLLLVLSDTSDTLSAVTKVLSDTTAVHTLSAEVGGVVGKTGTFADNTLTNNTQVVTLATATGGDVYIEQVIIEKDGTLFAGPTNLELSTDNAYGLTGADAPVASEATASLGAHAVVACTAASVTPMVPFVLESAKKLFAHGDDGAGTSAGNIKYTIVGRRMTAGATLA